MKRLKHNFKKGLAFVLSLAMVVGLVPAMSGGANTVQAATVTGSTPSVSAYATKTQLMNEFTPGNDGTASHYGKLIFGKNKNSEAQQWYILGKDTGVSGDNTIIFAASPIATGQKFEDNDSSNKTFQSSFGDYESTPSEVYPNHYGASDLRVALKTMASDTKYFTTAEQNLMNTTAVTTNDTNNSVPYTTKDKLYALAADGSGAAYTTIKAGSDNQTVLAMNSYWKSGDLFWLRSPAYHRYEVLLAYSGICVGGSSVSNNSDEEGNEIVVQPASNLNLSSVLFASSAGAASSSFPSFGTIADGTAMTLRLDDSNTAIGSAYYDAAKGMIVADKDAGATGTVSLVVQGKGTINGTENDWYYSVPIEGRTVVKAEQIKDKLALSENPSLTDCKIWLETTSNDMAYAKMAESKAIEFINTVVVTGMKPVGGTTFKTVVSSTTEGIVTTETTPAITYTTKVDGSDVAVTETTADWNKTYKASVILSTKISGDKVYVFGDTVSVTVDDETLSSDSIVLNADGTLTVTKEYTTDRRKIGSVTAPTVPDNNTFANYYTASSILTNGKNSELGTTAEVAFEGSVAPTAVDMDVTWTLDNANGAAYDATPGATNTFRWMVNADVYASYDSNNASMTGTKTITNKAYTAVPISLTDKDTTITYDGNTIDVSGYFDISPNAGTATYTNITGEGAGKGVGTIEGSQLTVTRTGEFVIKVSTVANGIYGPGEQTVTLTVTDGAIDNTAFGYTGAYDGKSHSIKVTVTSPADTTVTYSTDGTNYSTTNPSFTEKGEYNVYYKIVKNNYTTESGNETVSIGSRSISITAQEQSIVWGDSLDQTKYTVSENGLADGDSISEITLTPSTTALTENGTITISNVKIVNAAGKDVTGNYNIIPENGILKVTHNTGLVPTKIEAVKTKTSYQTGEILNVDDITVTAYYADGHSRNVTDYETNANSINMGTAGEKKLTVAFTENGGTVEKDITITVSPAVENSTTETSAVTVTQAEIQENSVKLNTGTSMVWKKDELIISWETISGADGYDIFAAKCGKKMDAKSLVKTVKGEKSSAALTKIAGKKLSGKEEYKVRIKAYKLINGKKTYIGSSELYHMAGKNNKTYTNAKKITVSKKSVTLKVGKTSQIKAKIVKQSNKKKLLSKAHGPALRYCSTDNSIATVTANGKIKAKGKGSCYIYVVALNGVKTKIKVKVK